MAAGIGMALMTLRQRAGLSIDEAAAVVPGAVGYLARVEAGERNPTLGWISHVSHVYADRIAALHPRA